MPKVEIEVKLSDEDRALLVAVTDAAKMIGGGKPEGEGDDGLGGDDDGLGGDDGLGEETGPTRDDVQTELRAFAGVTSKTEALALLKKHGGVDGLSKLPEAKFKPVIDAVKKATAAAKKKGK